ncbi:DUF333 domain-containing protein [Providencia rettgeri]|uniref:DUF333 domain-containing protein n=1 Tax=Providencia TaxID=586 RepID=UPI0022705C2D|nr:MULTISPECIES: DUF333 domain-containing protein [Providencia]MCX9123699.1 DUF333 domain-containing protein [Providencia rettgeri]MCX9128745.1 DUF333 domain-containing protein [Providencia rettgeri]HEM6844067.1 DUF333 domain-containing protein [Providencia rettgeri]
MRHRVNQFFKPVLTMLLTGAISVMLSACGSPNIDNSVEHSASQYAQQVVNLGPGAQEACVSAGGLPALTLELNGSQTAVCQFANGKRCAVDIIQSGACI